MGLGPGKDKRLYNIWACMKQRCNNPKNTAAPWYYDKGVRVCEQWNDDFLAFQSWAFASGYSEELTIDRIDPDGNYCPENCRWITLKENQARARRTRNHFPISSTQKTSKATTSNHSLRQRVRKGRYEVWDMSINLFAIVVKSGLMYSEAKCIVGELAKEHQPRPGHIFLVRKCKPLHKEGDFFFLKNGEEIRYSKM